MSHCYKMNMFVCFSSLGKTIQVIGFLSGMFDMDKVSNVLIVLPVSVMVNWEKEFSKWYPLCVCVCVCMCACALVPLYTCFCTGYEYACTCEHCALIEEKIQPMNLFQSQWVCVCMRHPQKYTCGCMHV